MPKPRIILADTDANFIIPMQTKFATDFFEKVDLEIITNPLYFEQLMAQPQSADILIVSEDLYSPAVTRHHIPYIFLMTEHQEKEQTAELNVTRIFKYTSIMEIFNEITGRCADVLSVKVGTQNQPRIVLVYSAMGGAGKTTVAMGVSACLARSYKRVLYIGASCLQTFQHRLQNDAPISDPEVYARLTRPDDRVYQQIRHVVRKEEFSYLPPFKAALMSLGLRYDIFAKLAVSARQSGDFDFVVVDAQTSFDEFTAQMFDAADRVILVTDQTASSVYATNQLVNSINGADSEKYLFVCNNFDKQDDNALISPSTPPCFAVSEYIGRMGHFDQLSCADLADEKGMQRTAFLVM